MMNDYCESANLSSCDVDTKSTPFYGVRYALALSLALVSFFFLLRLLLSPHIVHSAPGC